MSHEQAHSENETYINSTNEQPVIRIMLTESYVNSNNNKIVTVAIMFSP